MEGAFRISATGDALPAKEVGIFCFWRGGDLGHHLIKSGLFCGIRFRCRLGIIGDIGCDIVNDIRPELGCGNGEKWIHD